MTPLAVLQNESELSHERLTEAFAAFEQASQAMTRQYEMLQARIAELDTELEHKNRELSASLAERKAFGEYLESLLDNLSNGVMALTADGRVATANRAAVEMLGSEAKELINTPLDDISPELARIANEARSDKTPSHDAVEISTKSDGAAMETKVVECQVTAAFDLPDRDVDRVMIMREVTDLKRLERAANLRNRLTAMGEMAMNVAHEVRNPLGSIELFASALRQEVEEEPERCRLVDFISQGVRSIDNIVGNILMFARQMSPALEPVEPAALLDDVLAYARFHMEQKEIVLDREDNAGAARCLADGELMKQVFLNLLLNATQAMEAGGRLTLRCRATKGYIVFEVEDNGSGMTEDQRLKIFDPFYTTKRRGTGLGLTICHNIIQAHEGTIEVDSAPGEGTRFIIRVPRA